MDERKGKKRGGRPRKSSPENGGVIELRLETIDEAKDTLAALMKGYQTSKVSETGLRAQVYAARALLDYFTAIRDNRLEDLVRGIDERLRALEKERKA